MPKSKREKVVSLTRTDKKTKENKTTLIESVRATLPAALLEQSSVQS